MATRRTRIKGIAALPVRKKKVDTDQDTLSTTVNPPSSTENPCSTAKNIADSIINSAIENPLPNITEKTVSTEENSLNKEKDNALEVVAVHTTTSPHRPCHIQPLSIVENSHNTSNVHSQPNITNNLIVKNRESVITKNSYNTIEQEELDNQSQNRTVRSPKSNITNIVYNSLKSLQHRISEKEIAIENPQSQTTENLNDIVMTQSNTQENVITDNDILDGIVPLKLARSDSLKSVQHRISEKEITIENPQTQTPENLNDIEVTQSNTQESIITDNDILDGIVPLKLARSTSKPIDLLKNDIISENAEVLFDPIVPLPSPKKVRPKLRPVPRLNVIRRNSIQGSASESEDESRRTFLSPGAPTPTPKRQRRDSHTSHSTDISGPNKDVSRTRTDSVCSGASQITAQMTNSLSPVKATSPIKHASKLRRQEAAARRLIAMRRRHENVQRENLTMYDLIFYNPTDNPIEPEDEINVKETLEQYKDQLAQESNDGSDSDDEADEDAVPAPQIMLGADGQIVLNEKSLVIKLTKKKHVAEKNDGEIVVEAGWRAGAGQDGHYTRAARTAEWSSMETVRFYRALAAVGTDFSSMAPLFPNRTRRDLKIKFKKEEKINGAQVDKALKCRNPWDPEQLEADFKKDREEEERKTREQIETVQKMRIEQQAHLKYAKNSGIKQSKGSKILGISSLSQVDPDKDDMETADAVIKMESERKFNKIKKPKRTRRATRGGATSKAAATSNDNRTPAADNSVVDTPSKTIGKLDNIPIPSVPNNVENGSLVVLTINDPKSPTKKMLQTYISRGPGLLTPVALPPDLLNSVVSYVKKGKSGVSSPGTQILSPVNVINQDSDSDNQAMASANGKRQRLNSYTITQL